VDVCIDVGTITETGAESASESCVLAALAIVDDIGAVLVIAVFYSSGVSLTALLVAGALLALTAGFNRAGIRRPGA
jgi:NhaA family Na+:H+ antiporter